MIRAWFEDLIVQQWLRTLGWAGGVTLVIYVLGALGSSAASRASAAAVALALGFVAGSIVVLGGLPRIPPAERWQWTIWLTLGSLLLLFLEEAKGGQATLRFVILIVLIAALVWFVLWPSSLARSWTTRERQIASYGGGLGALLLLAFGEWSAPKQEPWRGGLAATIASSTATALLLATHFSEKLAKLEASLAAALFVCTLIAFVQRDVPVGRTIVTTATVAFGSLLLYWWAQAKGGLDGARALLLLASWCSAFVPLPKATPWRSLLVSVLMAGTPAAAAWLIAA